MDHMDLTAAWHSARKESNATSRNVVLIGAMDTKGDEYAFLRALIRRMKPEFGVLCVNTGIMECSDRSDLPIDVSPQEVLAVCDFDLAEIREKNDRGHAMKCIAQAGAVWLKRYAEKHRISGVLGCGGTGGTSVITACMRELPRIIPKVCLSTAGGTDCTQYVGGSNITIIPSIVDMTGVNSISHTQLSMAAGAIVGMIDAMACAPPPTPRPYILASMFGNTTKCVTAAQKHLDTEGYETLVFHAVGSGGEAMERLVQERPSGVLDITTTELADEVAGGVFSAGRERLRGPGRAGVPHVIAPGCIDMVNFHSMHSVPAHLREDASRLFYEWNPNVVLMRTNKAELDQIADWFLEVARSATGPVAILLPLKGFSILSSPGNRFHDESLDLHFVERIKQGAPDHVRVECLDCGINDPMFSSRAVEMLLEMIVRRWTGNDFNLPEFPRPPPPKSGGNRASIVSNLRGLIASKRPIIGAGAGTGISAKFEEAGGADMIIIYNSGRFRMAGRGSLAGLLPFKDANATVVEMGKEILGVVQQTPVLAGVCATDPFRSIDKFLAKLKRMGFAGVQNFPTVGLYDGHFRKNLEETGMSFAIEIEMIREAASQDLLTTPYAFNEREAAFMAAAGADVVVAHMGLTSKGSIGAASVLPIEDCVARVQAICDAAKGVNPDVIVLCHGGPISMPEDAEFIMTRTSGVHGFYGASSAERIPTEIAITEQLKRFKAIHML